MIEFQALEPTFFGRPRWLLYFAIVGLFLLGSVVRMLDLTDQPLDFNPERQLRAAIIARGMYYQMKPGADPALKAKAIAMWKNLEVFEPQIFERLVAVTYLVTGEHLWIARIYDLIYWIIGGLALFGLARRLKMVDGGVIALGFYFLLPFGAIASRSFQPDPFMTMWIIVAAYGIIRWAEERSWKWAILAGIFCGMGVLIKSVALAPIGLALLSCWLGTVGFKKMWIDRQVWVTGLLMVGIPGLYYLLSIGGRSGGFLSFWAVQFADLLIQPFFYIRWLNLIDSVVGLPMFFIGLVSALLFPKPARGIALSLYAGYIVYGMLLPYQIYTHNYYSMMLVPIIAFSLIPISNLALRSLAKQPRSLNIIFLGVALVAIAYHAWNIRVTLYSKDYRPEAPGWVKIGKELPTDGAIIGLTHDYGNRLRYYAWTDTGYWPTSEDLSLDMVRNGSQISDFPGYFNSMIANYHYFLVTLKGELDAQPQLKAMLDGHYAKKVTPEYILYDLSTKLK